MKRILFHGSEFVVEKPLYGKGARNNDYGRGFYCTENIELAKEWACAGNRNGYVNAYELDTAGFKILNLNDPEYSILNWLAFLADNRTYWQKASIAEEAKKYLQESGVEVPDVADEMYLDKSPEYWAGWALAFYQ